MMKTYHGSCHCGAVRFACDIDLGEGIRRCNCSFCRKTRMGKIFALGDGFRLLQGGEMLSDYRAESSNWPEGNVHHYFCKACGIRGFSKGYLDIAPFNGWFYAVNAGCLDDATDEELAAAPVIYEDGRHDDFDHAPKVTAYL